MASSAVLLFSALCFLILGGGTNGQSGINFDSSKKYKYTYEADVVLNEADIAAEDKVHRMQSDIGVKVGAVFEFATRWVDPSNKYNQVIEAQFQEAEIYNVSDRLKKDNTFYSSQRSKALRSVTKSLLFQLNNGIVEDLYVNNAETVTSLNIKKGILGLLQYQTKAVNQEEVDASGKCSVTYQVDGQEVTKIKDTSSCVTKDESYIPLNEAISVTHESTSRALYSLSDDLSHILYAVAMESHAFRVNIKKDVSLVILGRQKMGLMTTEANNLKQSSSKDAALNDFAQEMKSKGETYIKESLETIPDSKTCSGESCMNVKDVVTKFQKELSKDNMANITSAQAYITSVRAARQASQEALQSLLDDENFKSLRYTLIDMLAAAQTPASLEVLINSLDFSKKEGTGDIERALTGIAFSSHPSELTVTTLTKAYNGNIANKHVRETVALALGAALNKFCKIDPENCKSQAAKDVKSIIREGLLTASNEAEETLYVQFVQNSAIPGFIPQLTKLAEKSEYPLVNHLAITSMMVYDRELLDRKVLDAMNRIYHQNEKQYETTVRSAAANLILSTNPSVQDVRNILLSLSESPQKELSAFLLARIMNIIKVNHTSSDVIMETMKDQFMSNYWVMAQSGMASAFTGSIYKSDDSFGSYALFMEYSNAGMMRRTAVDVSLNSQGSSMSLSQMGIVCQGLEGLTGSVPDDGEENLDSMVGMATSMMGVKLRPLTFFRGYSDMMSMIWKGGDGDPAGVEAMLMLTDYLQHTSLASGLRVKAEVIGAISTKITADIAFSLWNRNVEIVSTNGGALSLQARLSLESPIIRASVRNSLEAQSAIAFSVFTDFSVLPPKSCMRLSYPPFKITKTLRKFERAKNSRRKLLALRQQSWDVAGITLPLHQGNSEMCSKILKK